MKITATILFNGSMNSLNMHELIVRNYIMKMMVNMTLWLFEIQVKSMTLLM